MQSVGEVLNSLKPEIEGIVLKSNQDIVIKKCAKCGNTIVFKKGQFRVYCKCGMSIFIKREKPKNEINCYLCLDKGIILYHAQIDNMIVEYGARCICPEGNKWPNIPLIQECLGAPPLEFIRMQNMKFLKGDRQNAGVI